MAAGDITAKRTNYSDFPCNIFDGVDDYVEIPHAAQQLGANLSNGYTISAWINPRSTGEGAEGKIFSKSDSSTALNGFNYGIESTPRTTFRLNGGTAKTGNTLTLGVWQHVLVTVTSAQLCTHYRNGIAGSTADLVQPISTITTVKKPNIGNLAEATTRTFDGSIRSVKMWNRVLSTNEITEEYNGKNHSDGLVHNFKLGGDYKDYGSVGVDATNSGSVANTTIPLKLQTNAKQLNLAVATDKIICIPRPGRIGEFALIGANRAAA